jgi:acetate kinase
MNILVINCGSSSVKYQVLDPDAGTVSLKGVIEKVNTEVSPAQALARVLSEAAPFVVQAVGHRVVHGGADFFDAVEIDASVVAKIEACVPLAPLHNPHNLAGIRAAQAALPDLPHIAVFDTAFHSRMPRRSRSYAIDAAVAEKHQVRRYGFHGPSHGYVAGLAADHLARDISELRIVTLHLGNGASACAVEFGHSTDTSMGMTPLEGLVMGTRAGDIDAGAVLAVMRAERWSADEMDLQLNKQSGLKGLSGISNDMREILSAAADGDDRARLAVTVFVHRARKYIGAYAAAMGGLDAVVLTGGIGENSVEMRRRILQRLDFLGLVVDEDRNTDARVRDATPVVTISRPHSRVQAMVVKTNEGLMIARQTAGIVNRKSAVIDAVPIPIAVSARHIHLTEETFAQLFGPDAEPTHLKDLSQPGQFAANETVNLIGPRNRIDGVRLLAPLRGKNQTEISRTDEFRLGVDAPVRDSGHVEGSAPITVEGPYGIVHLEEGLVCARRHIHMTPEDADRFRVKNKDEVEVAIGGGPRDLVFGDVLIRVSPKYALEMHIDTDEGNAAEFHRGGSGDLYTRIDGATATLKTRRQR